MKCDRCGQLLPNDSEFCQYCGLGLHAENPEPYTNTVAGKEGNTNPPPSQELFAASSSSPSNASIPAQDPNRDSKGNKADSIITISVCALLLAASGYFSMPFLLSSLVIGGILYLVMRKGLKIKGREFAISFLAILHSTGIFMGIWIVWILNGFNMDNLTLLVSSLDLVLCAALVVLACFFYVKKSRGCLKALLILESLYIGINAYTLLAVANAVNDAGIVTCHIAWRALIVFLSIGYLSDTKPAVDKTLKSGNRNPDNYPAAPSGADSNVEEPIRDRIV
ncbi:MAG: zinc ribbon domain-containing protein, partial [Synergistaceae bacterium]|nr:zinc ribbon domain-containing protein [Synergistaceae bacterium]